MSRGHRGTAPPHYAPACLIKSNKRESKKLMIVEEGRSRGGVEGSEGGGGVEGSDGMGKVKRWFSPGNLRDVNE